MSPARLLIFMALAILFMAVVGRADASPYAVMGDSLSSPVQVSGATAWPHLLWTETEVTNEAQGGWATDSFLVVCADGAECWADTGDADTIWIFFIGHNDLAWSLNTFGVGPTGDGYMQRLIELADLVQLRTGAHDFQLISGPYGQVGASGDRDLTLINPWMDEQAVFDQLLCASDPRFTCTVDLRDKLSWPQDYAEDGAHLNASGHSAAAFYAGSALGVPEPGSAALMGAGLTVLGILRKKRATR